MRIKNITYRLPGFYKAAVLANKYLDMSKTATNKFTILEFAKKHGMSAAADHGGVSVRTIYRWRSLFMKYNVNGLHDNYSSMNRNPKRWDPFVIREIGKLRSLYPNIGAKKIHPLLVEWCSANLYECPSISTIERIIASAPDKMRTFTPSSAGRAKSVRCVRKRERKEKGFSPGSPGSLVALDTIVRIIGGKRRYITVALDLYSRMAVALAGSSHKSIHSANMLRQLPDVFGFKVERVLTDNGSEFNKHFAKGAEQLNIKHWHTYPRKPQMNAHCERFNRTLWEDFGQFNQPLLVESIDKFNRKMIDWLLWYNCKRPHASLNYKAPAEAVAEYQNCHFDRGCTKMLLIIGNVL